MTGLIADIASGALILAGAAFFLIGAIGIVRMPELFTRIHAASLSDTTGMALILAGLAVHAGPGLVAAKLVILALFLLFMGPAATHALAAAALASGMKPLPKAKASRAPQSAKKPAAKGAAAKTPAAKGPAATRRKGGR